MTDIEEFVRLCLTQKGYPYKWGGKADSANPDPKGNLDCSGLVEWASGRSGHPLTGGSWQQLATCQKVGLQIPVTQAIATRGALLFIPANGAEHVAVSLGDGTTIEARGAAYGIGSWPATGRFFQSAAMIPGFDYTPKQRGNPDMLLIQAQDDTAIYLVLGDGTVHVPTPPDVQKLTAAGIPYVTDLSRDLVAGIVAKG